MSAIISQMGWDFQLVTTGPFSLEANKIFNSLSAAETYVKTDPTAYVGNVISVVGDEKAKNNGVYLVTAVGENGALVGAGSGAGSEAIANFTIVENKVSEATADNIGQIIYVTTGTEAYPAGPYIVTGAGEVAKLGTTTASGDLAGDVSTLQGKVSTLETTVGDSTKGLVADVDGIKTTIGDDTKGLVADIAANAGAIEANTKAVAELRNAVKGGVHFRGVVYELPWEDVRTIDGAGDVELDGYNVGDIIMVTGDSASVSEPTKEYILTEGEFYIEVFEGPDGEPETVLEHGYRWIELGDVSVSDQKIADLEKDFDDHVAGVAKMLEPYALAANVVANETFNQHVSDASGRMDDIEGRLNGIDEAILAIPVKSVATGDVLKLSGDGKLSVDMSNFVTKDGNKVLSDENYSAAEKSKLEGIATGAQVNVIETIQVNGTPISVEGGKVVNIDLRAYAKSADVVSKTLTINAQALTDNIVLDAQDIAIVGNIGDSAAGSSVEAVLGALHTAVVTTTGVANTALQTVVGSNAIAVTDKNNIALVVKSGSALTVGTDGLDLVWTEL